MAKDDLTVTGECTQHVGGLTVMKGIEAAAKRLAVDGHADRSLAIDHHLRRKPGCVLAKNLLKLRAVQTTQDEPQRGVSRSFVKRYAKDGVQAVAMDADEGVNLTIRVRTGKHCQHRKQENGRQWIHFPLAAARVGDLGKQRQQRALHLATFVNGCHT